MFLLSFRLFCQRVSLEVLLKLLHIFLKPHACGFPISYCKLSQDFLFSDTSYHAYHKQHQRRLCIYHPSQALPASLLITRLTMLLLQLLIGLLLISFSHGGKFLPFCLFTVSFCGAFQLFNQFNSQKPSKSSREGVLHYFCSSVYFFYFQISFFSPISTNTDAVLMVSRVMWL